MPDKLDPNYKLFVLKDGNPVLKINKPLITVFQISLK